MQSPGHGPRITRRRVLVLLGGSAAGVGLLGATGTAFAETNVLAHQVVLNEVVSTVLGPPAVAGVAAQPTAPLAGFRQAAQAGFSPINSTLTFGAPADLAAGWDGTLWAIDQLGAPHVYDPLSARRSSMRSC